MAQRSGNGVCSVMQELQQLRDKVCALSEKNRQLAKALTTAKQELTRARTAQISVFSDKVAEWMEARCKPVEVRHQAIQCSFEELDQGTCVSVEDSRLEPDPPLSPRRSEGAVRPKDPESENFGCANSESASGSEVGTDATSSTSTLGTASTTDSSSGVLDVRHEQRQRTISPHLDPRSERPGSLAGVKRGLRQRDASLSYVEPKLNTKLRRGDHYGLGKRSPLQQSQIRRPKQRMISEPRGSTSAFVPSLFGQQRSPFCRRTARLVKRVSYAEPKLNTKLRQGDKFTFST